MRAELTRWLADPVTHQALTLAETARDGDEVTEGTLRTPAGTAYPVRGGIPRFVLTDDQGQLQTRDAFAFKWARRESFDTPASVRFAAEWLPQKYGFDSVAAWAAAYDQGGLVVDIGCGAGLSSSVFLRDPAWRGRSAWIGVDISSAVDVARERLAAIPNTHFVQGDALQLPFADGSVDLVFSEGVLHHTPSTEAAIRSAARILRPGGQAHFYVYRKKGPVREFTDDYVRAAIAPLSDAEAWEAMRPLTELGRVLAEAHATVEVPDVPLLGIPAGTHDVQRLIYWHFAKLFWNDGLSFEENLHINFDWYRPRFAHRQTEAELRAWCAAAGLEIGWLHVQESGFTVKAVKAVNA